jgi:hypothetical protein
MSQATMKKAPAVQLEAPRFENAEPLRIAGLREHFTPETMKHPRAMAALWSSYRQHPRTSSGPRGLWLVFVGAVVSHLRVGDMKRIGPAAFLLMVSVAALVLRVLMHNTGAAG